MNLKKKRKQKKILFLRKLEDSIADGCLLRASSSSESYAIGKEIMSKGEMELFVVENKISLHKHLKYWLKFLKCGQRRIADNKLKIMIIDIAFGCPYKIY